ncbi:unnamed protein product [Leuciscus chuanchicus]
MFPWPDPGRLLGALASPLRTHLCNPGASGTHSPGGGTEEGGRGHHVGRAWATLSQRQAGTTTQSPSQAISAQLYTASDSSPLENNDKLAAMQPKGIRSPSNSVCHSTTKSSRAKADNGS